jgi:hypothetical protein
MATDTEMNAISSASLLSLFFLAFYIYSRQIQLCAATAAVIGTLKEKAKPAKRKIIG